MRTETSPSHSQQQRRRLSRILPRLVVIVGVVLLGIAISDGVAGEPKQADPPTSETTEPSVDPGDDTTDATPPTVPPETKDTVATTAPPPPPPPVDPTPGPWDSWSRDAASGEDRTLADPAAVFADSEFHAYSTTSEPCSGCPTHWVPHFTSPSLADPSTLVGDAMPAMPAWVSPLDRSIWAPSVAWVGDSYVLYFTATSGRPDDLGLKCLGVAVSPTPAGPFIPREDPLRCSPHYWSIDPYVVTDGDKAYLLWRQDDSSHVTGRIVGAALRADGLALSGEVKTLMAGEFDWEEGSRRDRGIGPIENPAMARHPVTGEWLLTWSANRWETAEYATGLATCAGPLGPCHRVSLDAPWVRTSADRGIHTSAQFNGCGGLTFVVGPDGQLYAMVHAYRGPAVAGPRVGWAYRVEHDSRGYRLRQF